MKPPLPCVTAAAIDCAMASVIGNPGIGCSIAVGLWDLSKGGEEITFHTKPAGAHGLKTV